MEKIVADWMPEVAKLKHDRGGRRHLSRERRRRRSRARSSCRRTWRARSARWPRADATRSTAARSPGRSSTTARRTAAFCRWRTSPRRSPTWVEPISTTYRGHTLYELPPNDQGLTALLLLNILEGIDLKSMRAEPVRYYHTLIEATKIAFADRNRYIADPAFAKVPVAELLSKDYAAKRRALIDPDKAIDPPAYGDIKHGQRHHLLHGRRQGSQRRLVHQQHLQLLRLRHRRRRHRHHAAQSRHRLLARGRPSEPARAGQAAVPHAHSGDGVQGRQAADVVRRDGRRHPGRRATRRC